MTLTDCMEPNASKPSFHKLIRQQTEALSRGHQVNVDELVDTLLTSPPPQDSREAKRLVRSANYLEKALFKAKHYEHCVVTLEFAVNTAKEFELTKPLLRSTMYLVRALWTIKDYQDALKFAREGAELANQHQLRAMSRRFSRLEESLDLYIEALVNNPEQPGLSANECFQKVILEPAYSFELRAPIDRKPLKRRAAHVSTLLKKL